MKFKWFIAKHFFSEDECAELSNIALNGEDLGVDQSSSSANKTSDVKVLPWSIFSDYKDSISNAIDHINHDNFGFDLYRLTNYDLVNYNRYEENKRGEYEWHRDGVQHITYDFKLTVILNVSQQSFEGGKFELFSDKTVTIHDLSDRGSILIFPSMFEHRVLPVTRGVRETISIWVKGPHFR